MTRPFVRIIDGDSVIEREMNDVEYEQYLTDQDMFEAEQIKNAQWADLFKPQN